MREGRFISGSISGAVNAQTPPLSFTGNWLKGSLERAPPKRDANPAPAMAPFMSAREDGEKPPLGLACETHRVRVNRLSVSCRRGLEIKDDFKKGEHDVIGRAP